MNPSARLRSRPRSDSLSLEKSWPSSSTRLDEQGKDGWELKGIIYELGLHAHLIFARQVGNDQ